MPDGVRVRSFRRLPGAVGADRADACQDPDFDADWSARLARTPHANFSMALEYLSRQARIGEASHAVLLDEGTRHGAMVLRERPGELVCGFPWRWQIVVEGADPEHAEGMTAEDAAWFFAHARRLAGRRRLRFHAPHPLPWPFDHHAGSTVLIPLAGVTEEQLFAGLHPHRRQWTRRSQRAGYEVVEGATPAHHESFDAVVAENGWRRHRLKPVRRHGAATSEWSEPWHWLFVALKDGAVAAGLGLGRLPGGMVDARASGSTPAALEAGTNSQVWWEALRHARRAGHTWMNLGGSTLYKRQFGGTVVHIHCGLAGPAWWAVPNAFEKVRSDGIRTAVRTRDHVRAFLRARAAKSVGGAGGAAVARHDRHGTPVRIPLLPRK